jgi:hypothetical protein
MDRYPFTRFWYMDIPWLLYICKSIYICIYVYIYIYICMNICMYIWLRIYVYIYKYIYIYVYIYIWVFVHIYVQCMHMYNARIFVYMTIETLYMCLWIYRYKSLYIRLSFIIMAIVKKMWVFIKFICMYSYIFRYTFIHIYICYIN